MRPLTRFPDALTEQTERSTGHNTMSAEGPAFLINNCDVCRSSVIIECPEIDITLIFVKLSFRNE